MRQHVIQGVARRHGGVAHVRGLLQTLRADAPSDGTLRLARLEIPPRGRSAAIVQRTHTARSPTSRERCRVTRVTRRMPAFVHICHWVLERWERRDGALRG
ncbi:hypothetical protein emb_1c0062 [Coriobacteriaceae bacterium EMTCatB1]|nr:hypothetical protein emb_1c0062 [Coriobacteriaceae bacterium EMTCatB1]